MRKKKCTAIHKNLLSVCVTIETLHIMNKESTSFHSYGAKPLLQVVRTALLSQWVIPI